MPVIKVAFREPRFDGVRLPSSHPQLGTYSILPGYESLTAHVSGLSTVFYPDRTGGYLQLLGPHGDVLAELALDTIRTIDFA